MGTVRQLAITIEEGLRAALPTLRKTVVTKLALAVGALLEAQTPNTVDLANVLPLETERQDMREQWLRRLLKNPLLSSAEVLEPWASQALAAAGQHGETIILSMDQTDLGDRFAILMISLGVGDRALPLAWTVEAGPANLGFEAQKVLLERVRAWLPAGAEVLLSADLSLRGVVPLAPRATRLALPVTAERESERRSGVWRHRDDGRTGGGADRALSAECPVVQSRGAHQSGDLA